MKTDLMPVLFIGHGSPMNALEDNRFTRSLSQLAKKIARPKAIVCISAHWMTEGSWITSMSHPKTIHDFYGFPQQLFDIQYSAPGDPALAENIRSSIRDPAVHADLEMWGLDHGSWSVLRHMYPAADIPVLQLSLHLEQPAEYHFKLGQKLSSLRQQGVLIVGSGNIVHNLRQIKWDPNAAAYDWALEYDQWIKEKLLKRDFGALVRDYRSSAAGKLSVPTVEHFLPLHYVLGAADPNEEMRFEYEEMQNASISMRCVSFGMS